MERKRVLLSYPSDACNSSLVLFEELIRALHGLVELEAQLAVFLPVGALGVSAGTMWGWHDLREYWGEKGGGGRCDELVGLVVSFITSPGGAKFCRHYFSVSTVPAEVGGEWVWGGGRGGCSERERGGFGCGDVLPPVMDATQLLSRRHHPFFMTRQGPSASRAGNVAGAPAAWRCRLWRCRAQPCGDCFSPTRTSACPSTHRINTNRPTQFANIDRIDRQTATPPPDLTTTPTTFPTTHPP